MQNSELSRLSDELIKTHENLASISSWVRCIGHEEFQKPPRLTKVHDIIVEIEDLLISSQLMEVGVELNLPSRESIGELSLNCRQVQVIQAIYNLVKNAYEAVASLDERWVSLEVQETETFIEFSILDSGKGVSEDIKSLILSGGKTTKKVGKGMGIGLQVVTEIIREHHGSLEFSAFGEPSRITIKLKK